jgi:hypothetical protein
MPTPNFLIVGAPKCGTTAMHHYLRRHPDVFMPEHKEPHYFADDVQEPGYIRDRREYEALFARSYGAAALGEASVWYLYSSTAPERIHRELGVVRIIAMLRHPVEMLHSLHNQFLVSAVENIRDFPAALNAEFQRRLGTGWPRYRPNRKLLYRDVVDYAPQLERYFDRFGRDNVQVVFYDDFAADPAGAYASCLRFLALPLAEGHDFGVVNGSRAVRSLRLQFLMRRPPSWLQQPVRALVPQSLRQGLVRQVLRVNNPPASRNPMPVELRRRLMDELCPRIERLEKLLGCDLTHWRSEAPRHKAAA